MDGQTFMSGLGLVLQERLIAFWKEYMPQVTLAAVSKHLMMLLTKATRMTTMRGKYQL